MSVVERCCNSARDRRPCWSMKSRRLLAAISSGVGRQTISPVSMPGNLSFLGVNFFQLQQGGAIFLAQLRGSFERSGSLGIIAGVPQEDPEPHIRKRIVRVDCNRSLICLASLVIGLRKFARCG